jgi:low temperature requirement protein LtrA
VADPRPTPDDARPASGAAAGEDPSAPVVGFLELFYDLVFVAATMVISNAFSSGELTWAWGARCATVFALLWVLWFLTTTLTNVERVDDLSHRALTLAQMFLIILTVLAFADKEASPKDYLGITYAGALVVVAVMHNRAARADPDIRGWALVRRNRLLVAALMAVATTWLPDRVDDTLFLATIVLLLVPTSLGRVMRAPLPRVDIHHLTERAALLTLIMCGEAFVKVALVVSEGTVDRSDVIAIAVEFVAVFALWFVYFDDIPKAGIRPGLPSAEGWALAHLPLQIGIVTVAVGISKFLVVDAHGVHEEVVLILTTGFVLVYGGLAVVGLLGRRTPIGPLTVARLAMVAVAIALGAVAWTFAWFTPAQMLLALAGFEIGHAVLADRLRRSTTVPALR